METTLLLNKEDFKDYADLAESLDMERLRPHIVATQRHRLLPLLTGPLATELLRLVAAERAAAGTASPAPLVAPWDELRPLAVAVVASGAMARYTPFSPITQTSHGPRVKDTKDSQPADGRDLARQAKVYDGEAFSYEETLAAWLRVNGKRFGDFCGPSSCCGIKDAGRQPSTVVQAIGRPEGYPTNRIPYGR